MERYLQDSNVLSLVVAYELQFDAESDATAALNVVSNSSFGDQFRAALDNQISIMRTAAIANNTDTSQMQNGIFGLGSVR